jgi:hypothetical protein
VIFERSESDVYSGFLSNATALKDFLILHCITIIQEIEGLLEVDKSPTCLYPPSFEGFVILRCVRKEPNFEGFAPR